MANNEQRFVPDRAIMEIAINLALTNSHDGGHAVAAVIVKEGQVIATGVTTINQNLDPTGHAELNAIRNASRVLKSKSLQGCYLYTTYEPCPMCAAAAVWARMSGIVYGAGREDATEKCPWRVMIPVEDVIAAGTPHLELYPKFMRDESLFLLEL